MAPERERPLLLPPADGLWVHWVVACVRLASIATRSFADPPLHTAAYSTRHGTSAGYSAKPNKPVALFSGHKTNDLETYNATHELPWSSSPNSILHIVQDVALVETETTARSIEGLQRIIEIAVHTESAYHEFNVTMQIQLRSAETEANRTDASPMVYLPPICSMQQLEIRRPFAEFRTLRKAIETCAT